MAAQTAQASASRAASTASAIAGVEILPEWPLGVGVAPGVVVVVDGLRVDPPEAVVVGLGTVVVGVAVGAVVVVGTVVPPVAGAVAVAGDAGVLVAAEVEVVPRACAEPGRARTTIAQSIAGTEARARVCGRFGMS